MTKPVLEKPYGVHETNLPATDFNRQIIEPNVREDYPLGAIGVYVDDDFWCVGTLPYKEYKEVSIEKIVELFWPEYMGIATFGPDHGSVEQTMMFLTTRAENAEARYKSLADRFIDTENENRRLRTRRTDIGPRDETRFEMNTNYFVRQYEHLLVAMAHKAVPKAEDHLKGICSICGLLNTDRVHKNKYLNLREKGYPPAMDWAQTYPERLMDLEDLF